MLRFILRLFDCWIGCWIEQIIATIIKFYVIKGGSLYVCGKGRDGCLGIEKYKNKKCNTPTLCPPFTNNNALKVSVSDNHTLVLDTQGDVWCHGFGHYGQLGNVQTINLYVPTKLNLGIRVIAVSAGRCHSLFLCEDGTVKACGSNGWRQIGLGELKQTLVPKTIDKLKKYKVAQISAGDMFSAAMTEGGALFCFGDNSYGQCGDGKEKGECVKIPTKVDLDDEIEFVECGSNHTLVITCKGLLYSFGSGNFGQVGHGDCDDKYVPKLIKSLEEKRIIDCAAGIYHSLCIDKEGIIWCFGANHYGQCGLSEDIDKQTMPNKIDWFVKNKIKGKKCFAGGYASSVITTDGCLYLFGRNDEYQLGLNGNKYYYTPTKLSISQNVALQSVSMSDCVIAMIWNVSK